MTSPIADRRRRLLREDIGRSAISLFAERGFDNVTVSDIAAAVGISERTFFRYFTTKDELLLDYQGRLWNRLVDMLAARPPEEGPVTALRQAFLLTSHVEPEDRARVAELGCILAQAPGLNARSRGQRLLNDRDLVDLVAARFPKRNKTATAAARVIVTAMNAVAAAEFGAWALAGGRGDPADWIRAALDILVGGLAHFDDTRGY